MAKSKQTFEKREREKQRAKKQQNKQEKMRERKSGQEKGKSLEDMMAYLDENGNLTDRPTDPNKKKIFRQEDIAISVPKQTELSPDEPLTGRISYFNDRKGFGFINPVEGGDRIFFHVNDLAMPVQENDKVTFKVKGSPRGPVAFDVSVIK